MMNKYKVPTLTSKTSKADKDKLMTALKNVAGVQGATLHPASNEFEIKANPTHEPKRDEITSASRKAGFEVEAKKKN